MRTRSPRRILVLDGHPDPAPQRFVHHLAERYRDAASQAGHQVRLLRLADVDVPLLRTAEDFERGAPSAAMVQAQESLLWAQHLVIVFPLWLGTVPALLKAFFEQVLRPGFAFAYQKKGFPKRLLAGRSARIFVTMGMPGVFYRLVYRAHGLRSLERSILAFAGFGPIRATVIGNVEGLGAKGRARAIAELEQCARRAR
jgi:putative NADPH-quinone reductase